jgi:hypothetical protein
MIKYDKYNSDHSLELCITEKAGTKIKLYLEFLEGQLHLPIIKVERI